MYSIDKEKDNTVEIDVHPISKWKRILLYLGDAAITFILGFILLNVAVMPLGSLIYQVDTAKSVAAEKMRDDILYEHELLFYRPEEGSDFPKYDFNKNLNYTFYRFLAYYVEPDVVKPGYPEYSHLDENEIVWTYYHTIRNDDVTYYEEFKSLNKQYSHFEIEGTSITLKQEVIDEVKVFFKPNESMGSKGKAYFNHLDSMFSGLFGRIIKDIYKKDLTDTAGHSFKEYQQIMQDVSKTYYWKVSICCIISYLISWGVMHLLIPLLNKNRYTLTAWIMKSERLAFKHLSTLSRGETAIASTYYLLFDMPGLFFLSLSYTTLVYAFSVPMLPILSIISLAVVLVSLFVVLFSSYNRGITDLLSQTVYVHSDDIDAIIKTRETIKELQMAEQLEREKNG